MNHYQKIAVVILRAVGCCAMFYAVAGILYGVVCFVLLGGKDTSPVPFVTGLLWWLSLMFTGAALLVLSRPLAYLIAGRFKDER